MDGLQTNRQMFGWQMKGRWMDSLMDRRTDRQTDGWMESSIYIIFSQFQSYRRLSSVTYDGAPDCLVVTQVPHSWLIKTHRFYLSHLDADNLAEISPSFSGGNKVDYDERGGLQERVSARRHGSGALTAGETQCLCQTPISALGCRCCVDSRRTVLCICCA